MITLFWSILSFWRYQSKYVQEKQTLYKFVTIKEKRLEWIVTQKLKKCRNVCMLKLWIILGELYFWVVKCYTVVWFDQSSWGKQNPSTDQHPSICLSASCFLKTVIDRSLKFTHSVVFYGCYKNSLKYQQLFCFRCVVVWLYRWNIWDNTESNERLVLRFGFTSLHSVQNQ